MSAPEADTLFLFIFYFVWFFDNKELQNMPACPAKSVSHLMMAWWYKNPSLIRHVIGRGCTCNILASAWDVQIIT